MSAVDAIDFRIPFLAQSCGFTCVDFANLMGPESAAELFNRHSCIPDQRQCRLLRGIEFRNVDIDKSNSWILKCRYRCGCEVAVAGSDSDDQICLQGQPVCDGSASY